MDNKIIAGIIIITIILAAALAATYSNSNQQGNIVPTPSPTPNSYNIPIGTGQEAVVKPGTEGYIRYEFIIPSGSTNIQATINFTASGGSGNDIKVYILDGANFEPWKNGKSFSNYYYSGQIHTDNAIIKTLMVGKFYLVFDNTFSSQSTKYVNYEANLHYSK